MKSRNATHKAWPLQHTTGFLRFRATTGRDLETTSPSSAAASAARKRSRSNKSHEIDRKDGAYQSASALQWDGNHFCCELRHLIARDPRNICYCDFHEQQNLGPYSHARVCALFSIGCGSSDVLSETVMIQVVNKANSKCFTVKDASSSRETAFYGRNRRA